MLGGETLLKKLGIQSLVLLSALAVSAPQVQAARSDSDYQLDPSRKVTREQGTANGTSADIQNIKLRSIKKGKDVQAAEIRQLTVSGNLLSMTEAREIDVEFDASGDVDLSRLKWTFGGKDFSEWKKFSAKSTKYDGEPFISFVQEPYLDGTTVKARIKFDLIYTVLDKNKQEIPTSDLSPRGIRVRYPELLGNYELAVKDDAADVAYKSELKLNVYDNFHTYNEIKPSVDDISKRAIDRRYLNYEVIGQSVQGRDMHFVVLAKDKKSVDTYLNKTLPDMLNNPKALKEKLDKGKLKDYKVPIWFNNPHPDESPAMDVILDLLDKLATEKQVSFDTTDESGREQVVDLNVDEALDNFIFLFNLSHNPDGRVANTRANANGFDLNRDHSYQTQVEDIAVTQQMAKWTPLSFLDFHGFVKGFLIEPCTPPHNPNYEFDLLMKGMIDQAHAMGRAGIANSKYKSYTIPMFDDKNGWDDYSPAYTPMFAMAHGSLGHTIEMPELNQESFKATEYAGLGAIHYMIENKDELFRNQLELFQRGIDGEDNPAVDEWLVNQDGEQIGRPRDGEENFFPEYYVIPMDQKLQKNPLEAAKMVDYLLRNGIQVGVSTQKVKVDGISYPEGTYVVDMHQAKRGLANIVLFDGEDISDWDAMYDSVVQRFHDLRGFTRHEIRQENAFKKKTRTATKAKFPTTKVTGDSKEYIIRSVNNDVIKAVNELLRKDKAVKMVTESGDGYEMGDFVVSKKDLQSIKGKYYLETIEAEAGVEAQELTQPKVASVGSGASRFVLEQLGFELTAIEDSTVIVDDAGRVSADEIEHEIEDGKDYIGIGGSALEFIKDAKLLRGFDFDATDLSHEGVLRTEVAQDDVRTAPYDEDEMMYSASGAWITELPEDAKVLLTISEEDDFYQTGWWPGHDAAKGQTLAFTVPSGDADVTVFANDIVFRAHPQFSYRLLANSIYAASLEHE